MTEDKFKAVLLIGATGTGKTPFGEQLETQALWEKQYHHFDFGEQLRNAVSAKEKSTMLKHNDIERINSLLKSNSLLGDSDFHIAEKLLKQFIRDKAVSSVNSIIVLNGLPRHSGQADAVSAIVDIELIIYFSASASVIKDRIAYNSGGDRTDRTDDSVEEIENKLKIFRENTMPLISYYKKLDKTILEIDVDIDTIPLYIIQEMKSMPPLL